jgi:hypothetical protein
MDREALQKLIDEDDLGLLDIKPLPSSSLTPEERLVEKFYKIIDFYRIHDREPHRDPGDMQEAQLAMSLEGIRQSNESVATLKALDEFGLLEPPIPPESLDDIFEDDDMGLLDGDDDPARKIFNLKHIPKALETPDFVAQREPCDDFEQFEPLFKSCQKDLLAGKRKLLPFAHEQQIETGQFFVLKGIMTYVADVGEKENKGGKINARLRCIFENGTESAMLLRSLARELYKDGRRVTVHEDDLLPGVEAVTDKDTESGKIYILRSLSNDPDIADKIDLFKIGFCRGSVEDRIRHAKEDPTYLFADVKIVSVFDCYNLNPQKLELIMHKFFGRVCLDVDVFDSKRKRHTPREWFIAPLPVIEEAVRLSITGEIIHYAYDPESKLIRKNNSKPTDS